MCEILGGGGQRALAATSLRLAKNDARLSLAIEFVSAVASLPKNSTSTIVTTPGHFAVGYAIRAIPARE